MSKESVLISSRYKPAAGGHAPGDLRDAFLGAVEDLRSWRPGMPELMAEVRDQPVPLSALCGLLWNCTDCLPGIDGQEVWAFVERYGDSFDDGRRASSSYGRAARALKPLFEGERQAV